MSHDQKIENIKSIVKKYVTLLKMEGLPVEKAYLYGSFAKGYAHPDSDIDVCVVSKKFNPNKDKDRLLLWNKVRETDYRLEPVGFRPDDFVDIDPLVYEIKKFGIRAI